VIAAAVAVAPVAPVEPVAPVAPVVPVLPGVVVEPVALENKLLRILLIKLFKLLSNCGLFRIELKILFKLLILFALLVLFVNCGREGLTGDIPCGITNSLSM
jgi:hypothetical protein